MESENNNATPDVHLIVQQAIEEYTRQDASRREPAYKAELAEERKRREQLERRLNEVVEENKRSRKVAQEAERSSAVRAELQRLGVAKIDLAFKAVQDGIKKNPQIMDFAAKSIKTPSPKLKTAIEKASAATAASPH